MNTPFEELGLRAPADPEEIRKAYRGLVKQCHPDMVQDPAKKQEAQERMVRLNLAYEEALRLTSPRQHAPIRREISCEDAVIMAERMLRQAKPECALRQLMRAEGKDGRWFFTYGKILMQMDQYHEAHLAFREAVRREPENREYRSGALEAALAERKEKTVQGRVRKVLRGWRKKAQE